MILRSAREPITLRWSRNEKMLSEAGMNSKPAAREAQLSETQQHRRCADVAMRGERQVMSMKERETKTAVSRYVRTNQRNSTLVACF